MALQDQRFCGADPALIDSELFVIRFLVAGMVSTQGWNPYTVDENIDWTDPAFDTLGVNGAVEACWGSGPHSSSLRMRDGIERFFMYDINDAGEATAAQSLVPVMFDLMSAPNPSTQEFPDPISGLPQGGRLDRFNHIPSGINCLYLDGHVEFLRYPDNYPATPGAAFFVGGAASWASAGDDLWTAYALAPNGPF